MVSNSQKIIIIVKSSISLKKNRNWCTVIISSETFKPETFKLVPFKVKGMQEKKNTIWLEGNFEGMQSE